jgi:uncharacterized protein DUF6893
MQTASRYLTARTLMFAALIGATALIVAELPEIRRYAKMLRM